MTADRTKWVVHMRSTSNEARQSVLTAAPPVNSTDSEDYDSIKVCAANLDSSHSPVCT
ncbi:hypothetical protein CT19431_40085 [Cupriavidus taiwanensis]|nr:hypothetical protein CT19431_40085 [Cupriavidus taiwanensis]